MSIILSVIVFVIGAIVGALAVRFLATSSIEQKELREKVEKSEFALHEYKGEVAEHLDNSAKLLSQMNETCQAAMQQMEKSTKLLQQATPKDVTAMPFFSKETQEQLAETVNLRRREKSADDNISEPPLDYSAESSGLFVDKKQTVTNTEPSI